MIHEALNNCRKDLNLIIVMNENEMSISKNIGRFATNLSKLRASSGYFRTKKVTGSFLKKIPLIGGSLFRLIRGVKKSLKNILYGSNYFESMGLTYLGPIDGNDYAAVENLLREAKKLGESVVVHLKTTKGKGFAPAENAPEIYHGMQPHSTVSVDKPSFSLKMGQYLTEMAEQDSRICAITAAMCDGTGLCSFRERFPERFFDVGIAEEHALTFAAGLAANGMKPYTAIYSTFLQRGYDNLVHDIALQRLPCVIGVDRAGLNAGDGATHHGIFDVSFLSQIPNITIYTPCTYDGLKKSLEAAFESELPCAIRYPNGTEQESVVKRFYPNGLHELSGAVADFDKEEAPDLVIVTHGRIVTEAMKAAERLQTEGIRCGIILLEVLKPYAQTATGIMNLLPETNCGILLLEEEIRSGGMGMNMSDVLRNQHGVSATRIRVMAVEDSFVEERTNAQTIYEAAGIDANSICRVGEELLSACNKI